MRFSFLDGWKRTDTEKLIALDFNDLDAQGAHGRESMQDVDDGLWESEVSLGPEEEISGQQARIAEIKIYRRGDTTPRFTADVPITDLLSKRYHEIKELIKKLNERADKLDERFDKMDKDITVLDTRITRLEGEIPHLRSDVTTLHNHINTAKTEVSNVKNDVTNLDSRVNSLSGRDFCSCGTGGSGGGGGSSSGGGSGGGGGGSTGGDIIVTNLQPLGYTMHCENGHTGGDRGSRSETRSALMYSFTLSDGYTGTIGLGMATNQVGSWDYIWKVVGGGYADLLGWINTPHGPMSFIYHSRNGTYEARFRPDWGSEGNRISMNGEGAAAQRLCGYGHIYLNII